MQTSNVKNGNYGVSFHYFLCGATDGSCGAASQDINRFILKQISSTHFFARGWFYLQQPAPGAVVNGIRKFMYFKDSCEATSGSPARMRGLSKCKRRRSTCRPAGAQSRFCMT